MRQNENISESAARDGNGPGTSEAHMPEPGPEARRSRRTDSGLKGDAARQARIERAKQLVANPNYPSREVLEGVANVLADKWAKPRKRQPRRGG